MTNGLYTTGVGLVPHMYKQDIIANNLANVNTTGFKKDGLVFKKLIQSDLIQSLNEGDAELLTQIKEQYTDYGQGPLVSTGNPLDVALAGKGFLVVETPEGIAYTRNGNFTLNEDGVLVNNLGYPVLGEDGTIEIDNAKNVIISDIGEIYVDEMKTNKFLAVDFNEPVALKKIGDSLYIPQNDNVEEIAAEDLKFNQMYLEQSNVNPVKEMVDMITTLRRFEAIQRTLKLHNDSLGKAVNELGRGK